MIDIVQRKDVHGHCDYAKGFECRVPEQSAVGHRVLVVLKGVTSYTNVLHGRLDSIKPSVFPRVDAVKVLVGKLFQMTANTTHYFCVLLMFNIYPFNLNILSSKALVWSESCPCFAGGSLLGSLSTMISKSMSFSVRVDMSFSKQNEYSPTVLAVRT